MIQKSRAPRRAFRRLGFMGVLAALAAVAFAAVSASAATPSANQMQVNPVMTPAPAADSTATGAGTTYRLRTCQVGLSVGQCYDPYQMRKAYGVDSLIANGYDGTGKTIVILDAFSDPNLQSNFSYFNNYYGLPDQTIAQYYPGGQANTPYDLGWSEEMQLDVDWSHAIAPGAKIVIVHAQSNSDQDLIAGLNYAVDNNLGDVISMSFGESDQCLGPALQAQWHQGFVNATKKGITLFASSGDQGASQPSCDGNSWIQSTSAPASDPLVTAVGGTELHAADFCLPQLGCNPASNPLPGTWLSEPAWNEGPTGDFSNRFGSTEASGGGFSTVWSEPAYQQGTIHGGKQRAVPDVAYNGAILHGVLVPLIAEFGGFFRFGGTSCGSPQWAAITAIADQQAGHDYGFINSALYKAAQDNAAAAFNDVTSGNNSALEYDASNNAVSISGFSAGPGWDAVTGLGSPKAGGLLSELALTWGAGQGQAAISNSKNG